MGSIGTMFQTTNVTRIAKAQYYQRVTEQVANNKREAARVTLAEFSRTLGNQMRMEAAGKEYNYALSQLNHELEQSGKARLNNQLQHAEASGALTAQAGALGVGGSSVELMDTLIDLQDSVKEEQLRRGIALMGANGKRQTAQVITNSTNSVDLQRTFGSFDYSKHVAPKDMKNRLLKGVIVAVAGYFGGPMAAEAAADAFVGGWKASNGDFAGANANFGSSMSNGAQAFKQYNDRGGTSWWSTVSRGSGGGSGSQPDMGEGLNLFETDGKSGWGGWGWG